MKKVLTKVLLISLCLVLAAGCFVSCDTDDQIASLQETIKELEAKIEDNKTKLETVESKENVGKLEDKVDDNTGKIEDNADKIDANAKAEAEALAAKVQELNAEIKKIADDLKAATDAAAKKTDLDAAKTELNTKLNTISTNLSTVSGKVTTLETNYTALSGKLEDYKTEVGATYATKVEVNNIKTSIENLNTTLATLTQTVNTLKNADVFEEYKNATELLEGEGEYSLYAFDIDVQNVVLDKALYYVKDYNAFMFEVQSIRFFLSRAITEAQVKAIWAEYKLERTELVKGDAALAEVLDALIGKITQDPDCMDEADTIFSAMKAAAPELVEDTDAITIRYRAYEAAHDYLLTQVTKAGTDVLPFVAAVIDEANGRPYIILNTSKTVLTTANGNYITFKSQFDLTTNGTVDTKYLYADTVTVDSIIDSAVNGTFTEAATKLATYKARYEELNNALLTVIKIENEKALAYETTRPIYSDITTLNPDLAEVQTWAKALGLLDEDGAVVEQLNIDEFYKNDEYELLVKAANYANAMNALFTEDVKTVLTILMALKSFNNGSYEEAKVMFAEYGDVMTADTGLKAKYEDFVDAIVNVDNADFNDDQNANLYAMINAVKGEIAAEASVIVFDLGRMFDRLEKLADAMAAANALMVTLEAKVGKITYADTNDILDWQNRINGIMTTYKIAADDETVNNDNYDLIIKNLQALRNDLRDEYNNITAGVKTVYDAVAALSADKVPLVYGKTINATQAQIQLLVAPEDPNMKPVNDANLWLIVDKAGVEAAVNLSGLFTDMWPKAVNNYKTIALAAQDAATKTGGINEMIVAIEKYDTTTLNNYDAIVAVYDAYKAWAEQYGVLAEGKAFAENSNKELVDALTAVDSINIYGTDDTYKFVTVKNLEKLLAQYDAIVATAKAAADDWADIKVNLEKLNAADKWQYTDGDNAGKQNIHNQKFAEYEKAYRDYLEKYYAVIPEKPEDPITYAIGTGAKAGAGVHDEVAVYGAFATQLEKYNKMVGEANTAAKDIIAAIKNLNDATIDLTNAQTGLRDSVKSLVAAYKTAYGCDFLTHKCDFLTGDAAKFDDDALLAYKKLEAKVLYTAEFIKVTTKNATWYEATAQEAFRDGFVTSWTTFNTTLADCMTLDAVANTLGLAKTTAADWLEMVPAVEP